MLLGSLALAGVFPLAGFWSKDALLVAAWNEHHLWLFGAFVITALITAFYTTRMVLLTFFGEYRGTAHPHESPPSMAGPLVVLAGATAFLGFLGSPILRFAFGKWVFFDEIEAEHFVFWIAALGTLAAGLGILAGYSMYRTRKERDPLQATLGPVWNVLEHRYYIDAFYMRAIIYPVRDTLSAGVYWVNQNIIDGVVNGAAGLARALSRVVMWFDRNVIDGFINGLGNVAGQTGGVLKRLQSGNVQWYAAGLFLGVVALAIVFIKIA
jgi:NADH-quinone oxidoreductase subunit L